MLRALRVAVLCLPLLAAGAAVAGHARQSDAPASVTTFVLRGRGYGHGVGMGQWGAYGQAKRGVGYAAILSHYYPGTKLTRKRSARVRVLLAEGQGPIRVSSSVPFSVEDGAGAAFDLEPGSYPVGRNLAVKVDPSGAPTPLEGPLTFLPGSKPLMLGEKAYRGRLVVQRVGSALQAVNVVALDPYVRGVVTEEVPEDWPLEAIKAQAVAARSYGLAAAGSVLYADTRGQVYSGVAGESKAGDRAVAATSGEVLTFEGKVATTFFYSSSGGRTADVKDAWVGARAIPYLTSVPDPDDKVSPYHRWGPVVFSAAELSKALGVRGATDLRAVPTTGRSRELVVAGASGEKRILTSAVRTALGLRSGWVTPGVLTLSRPTQPFAAGVPAALTGVVRKVKGPVELQQKGKGAWQTVGSVAAAQDGRFSVTIKPAATSWYRLAAADDVVSTPLRVPVGS